ncbi:MAG: polysaccharide biosynthesis tyrosine autokinase [Planctomycetaceae bacterium]|nr:polysaccharide biosynthesis tyrosine autokinase [Planctomycetaceae bacterium]MCB9952352.1 polysaccharide biosynthesis tyrosine autokinase [Planctomycetaceae bacterium]
MSSTELPQDVLSGQGESIDILATALRFYRSVLRRKWVLVVSLMFTLSLAAMYYMTATRLYESKAELIFLNAGGNVLDDDQGGDHKELTSQMPNYERIMQSDRVLKATLKSLPEEHLVDVFNAEPEQWLEQFRRRMSISTLRNTNSMTVSFRSENPETAYVVVDALLTAYLTEMNSLHHVQMQEFLRILQEGKIKGENDIKQIEAELESLKNSSQVLFSSDDQPTNVLAERVRELNTAYVEAQKLAYDSQALLLAITQAHQRGEDLQAFASAFDQELGSKIIQTHLGVGGQDVYTLGRVYENVIEYKSQLGKLLQTHGRNNPEVLELQQRIDEATQFLAQHRRAQSDGLNQMSSRDLAPLLLELAQRRYEVHYQHQQQAYLAFQAAQQEALQIESKLNRIAVLQGDLQRARDSYAKVMEGIDARNLSKESGVQVSPISPPKIDRRPVTPKLASTAAMGLMAGVLFGCMVVYVLDFVDDRFHSPDDLRLTIGTPILAMIRKLPYLAPSGLESLYPYAKPNSVESEAFRTLRTAIDFHTEDLKRITISSTEPSDGKTTVLASLGVAFAQAGKRTLMIDGDMRRPGLTRLFEHSAAPGLSNILKDNRPVWDIAERHVIPTGLDGLDVIPAGPRPMNPVELLTGDRLSELIAWAEGRYDQLLIDAPPSLAVADVQVIGRLVDAALLTVRPDKNRRKMVIRAAEALTSLGCNLLGIVVNHVEPKSGGDYAYGYGYGYGYGEGYGHDDSDASHPAPPKRVTVPVKRAA